MPDAAQQTSERTLRARAVENVDRRYGFTCEFSTFPVQHAAEYDEEEWRLAEEEAIRYHDERCRRTGQPDKVGSWLELPDDVRVAFVHAARDERLPWGELT